MSEEVVGQSGVNVESFFQPKEQNPSPQESGEPEEVDTSEESDEEKEDLEQEEVDSEEADGSEDADEEDEPEEDEKKPKKKKSKSLKDWKDRAREAEKKLEAEEERRKGFQRETSHAVNRLSQVEQEMQALMETVESLKSGNADSETDDLLESLGDGLVEADKVKKVIKGMIAKQTQAPKKQEPATDRQFNPWMTSLPDYQEVEEWYAKEQASAQARINMLPTKDPFARVQEVRVMHKEHLISEQEKEIAKLKSRVKVLQKRKSGKVPVTGPQGRNAANPRNNNAGDNLLSKFFQS